MVVQEKHTETFALVLYSVNSITMTERNVKAKIKGQKLDLQADCSHKGIHDFLLSFPPVRSTSSKMQ